MLPVTIISASAAAILLIFFIFHILEMKNMKKQTERLITEDSNELVHSLFGGSFDKELINEINSLLKEMRHSKELYNKKSHDLEQMLTNIAHDLRTPLASAMGYIDLIINSELPPEEKDREILIVQRRLNRLEELLNSFFEFSQIISRDQPPELSHINLTEVIQESIVHYYDDFCAKDREIRYECEKIKIPMMSNRNMLIRIFDNLIGNALKHGSGTLVVTIEDREDAVHISFRNSLSDNDLNIERVFDEFYTTDISRTKGNTGLGLAIAKQFTQMLGGSISADYDGKEFSVNLEFPIK